MAQPIGSAHPQVQQQVKQCIEIGENHQRSLQAGGPSVLVFEEQAKNLDCVGLAATVHNPRLTRAVSGF